MSTSQATRIVPVILSGGSGTRLWPSSRAEHPKQFLPLVGSRSTFEDTLERISDQNVFHTPIIVTGSQFEFLVAEEVRKMKVNARIILEPMRRDSAPAIAVAAEAVRQVNPEALMTVLAADHIVRDKDGFLKAVLAGVGSAQDGHIVTFGITPDSPATGYGYIEPVEHIGSTVYRICRFTEKPNAAKAQQLINQGCLWNSGNFLFRADVLLGELALFEPAIPDAAVAAADRRKIETVGAITLESLDPDSFEKSPAKSIDFAVMERTSKSAIVPASYGWSDVGSWDALWSVSNKDSEGNVANGDTTLFGVRNSFVSSEGVHTAAVGVDGLVIIATRDAVLVAPRDVANELKPLVAKLQIQKSTRSLTEKHKVNRRCWGSEERILSTAFASAKSIRLNPGETINIGDGSGGPIHFVVVRGQMTMTTAGSRVTVSCGESVHLDPRQSCKIMNDGSLILEWVEINVHVITGSAETALSSEAQPTLEEFH